MKKLGALVLIATGTLLVLAAPAAAFKDPFDPVVTSDSDPSTTGETSTTVDDPTVTNGENPFSEGVPTTGADTSSWLVLSYVLVVVGGAALVLGRVLQPARPACRQDFRS